LKICSPLFVPVIAAAIGNKKVIVSGLTVGIIGYAIGNYLGYIVAEVLKAFEKSKTFIYSSLSRF
jgi:uncharacterized membrane protein